MRRRRPADAIVVAALALAGIAPRAVMGADDLVSQTLPHSAHAAVVTDLDGDGTADLVRIRQDERRGHVVEAWSADVTGASLLGSAPIPSLNGSDDGVTVASQASGLLLWRLDGSVRVLAISAMPRAGGSELPMNCCLSIFEVTVGRGGLALEERDARTGRADSVQAVDVDADGTDELVRQLWNPDGQAAVIEVLRWDGAAFRSAFVDHGPRATSYLTADSDGLDGVELLLGVTPGGEVTRVSWAGGEKRTEIARVPLGEGFDGWIAGTVDGAMVISSSSGIQLVDWPSGGQPRSAARVPGVMYVAGIVEGDDGALIAAQEPSAGVFAFGETLTLFDSSLRRVGTVAAGRAASTLADFLSGPGSAIQNWQRYPWPYAGPFLAGDAEPHDGFVWNGLLVTATGRSSYESEPIALMPNMQPVGRIGPGDGWIALINGWFGGGTSAYLSAGGSPPPGFGSITLVPAGELVEMPDDERAPHVDVHGAVAVPGADEDAPELFASGDGFEVTVTAPPGSWVASWDGQTVRERPMEADTVTVPIEPRSATPEDEDLPLDAAVIVTTLDGHVAVAAWTGTYVREPPPLTVEGRTETFSFGATLAGEVGGSHSSVEVDGRPVSVDRSGRFEVSIGAVPWPHDVVVTVRDLVGNETLQRVQVIGLVDYRGLPWAALAVIVTLGVGARLFARIPRGRSRAPARDGDGALEELDLDEIEAISEPRPGAR